MNQLVIPAIANTPDATSATRWQADLELRFERTVRGCRLARNYHRGPLYVQKPFFPEGRDLAHVYLLHPPGGLVSGDQLDIRVAVDEGAQALVTTTGAGRVYRARPDALLQCQNTFLRVARDASLEWLPLENIAYPGANGAMTMRVDLEAGARFAGWEVTSLGLPACDEDFSGGRLLQRLEIFREGKPLLVESLRLGIASGGNGEDGNILQAAAGLRSFPVNGLLVMGPFTNAFSEELLEDCRALVADAEKRCIGGVTLVANMFVVRVLGHCAFEVRGLLTKLWEIVRPELLDRPACAPRIWRT
ncbi:urease accessory protein UreD [Microbulbifer sp. HZ11]|uniref:urease accessory protein UreD n=1 Tax=Microbulbifer sp. HZ11 TaxID=1453501 RepID=UPI0005B7DCD1|nr:urease accessory protein UreD [Microbulbifer sp. HZ11]